MMEIMKENNSRKNKNFITSSLINFGIIFNYLFIPFINLIN